MQEVWSYWIDSIKSYKLELNRKESIVIVEMFFSILGLIGRSVCLGFCDE